MVCDIKLIPKGWGCEKWITNTELFCGKILYFLKGKRCSWHFHKLKTEVFYVLSGSVELEYGYDPSHADSIVVTMGPGDKFDIPCGLIHRIVANEDSEIVEFSTQHFDSDSIRIENGDTI